MVSIVHIFIALHTVIVKEHAGAHLGCMWLAYISMLPCIPEYINMVALVKLHDNHM